MRLHTIIVHDGATGPDGSVSLMFSGELAELTVTLDRSDTDLLVLLVSGEPAPSPGAYMVPNDKGE